MKGRYLYLPRGQWYDYWTDKMHQGGIENWVDADLDRIPMFIRPGAVIPFHPVMQYVGEKEIEVLDLHIYYGDQEVKSRLYEDGGEGYNYEKGIYTIKKFTTSGTGTSFKIEQKTNGHFEPGYRSYRLILHGLPFEIKSFSLNGKKEDISSMVMEGTKHILEVPGSFLDIQFEA